MLPGLAIGYAAGVRRTGVRAWRVACFVAGLALLLAVAVSPIHTLGVERLLIVHLLQNVVLAEWAPLLLVLGVPPGLARALAGLPGWRLLTHPLVALPLWLATYFAWHLPPLYEAALRHPHSLLHLEHGMYLATGILLWWCVLQDEPHRLGSGERAAYVFAAFVLCSPLGLLLALIPEPVYGFYEDAPRTWGLTALEDQQLGGILMSLEQATVFFAVFAYWALRFLREQDGEREARAVVDPYAD